MHLEWLIALTPRLRISYLRFDGGVLGCPIAPGDNNVWSKTLNNQLKHNKHIDEIS